MRPGRRSITPLPLTADVRETIAPAASAVIDIADRQRIRTGQTGICLVHPIRIWAAGNHRRSLLPLNVIVTSSVAVAITGSVAVIV